MFGRHRYFVCNSLEIKYKSITLLFAVTIASAKIQKNIFVSANEQQPRLGEKTHTYTNIKGMKKEEKSLHIHFNGREGK